MISFVRGTVVHVAVDALTVDLGSVGVRVLCTPSTAAGLRTGDHVELLTTMVVREDGWTLYGFSDADARDVFEKVQTVSGIGPRIALALLGSLSPDELRRAVSQSDEAALTKVPGIGRKGAQRLILELADRLGAPTGAETAVNGTSADSSWQAAVSAGLVSLGWSAKDAEGAIAGMDAELRAEADAKGSDADIGALLKAALQGLSRA